MSARSVYTFRSEIETNLRWKWKRARCLYKNHRRCCCYYCHHNGCVLSRFYCVHFSMYFKCNVCVIFYPYIPRNLFENRKRMKILWKSRKQYILITCEQSIQRCVCVRWTVVRSVLFRLKHGENISLQRHGKGGLAYSARIYHTVSMHNLFAPFFIRPKIIKYYKWMQSVYVLYVW